jgi:hypothetical protein
VYCFDTSALIAAWDERYPTKFFPKFWKHIEKLRDDNRFRLPEAVFDETAKGSGDLHKWLGNEKAAIIGFEPAIQQEAKDILKVHPRLVNASKGRNSADPFVIATAKIKTFTVVTEEGMGSTGKPKIPDVCQLRGVPCIGLIQLIETENWVCG